MNNYIKYFSILFLIIVISYSCKKDKVTPPTPEEPVVALFGEVDVLLNGTPYLLQTGARESPIEGKFSLYFEELNVSGIVARRNLSFTGVEKKVGTVGLESSDTNPDYPYASFDIRLYDGDVFGDYYEVLEIGTLNNTLTIDSIDATTNEIWGSFDVTVVRDTSDIKKDLTFPDTLHFSEGVFHTKIFPR